MQRSLWIQLDTWDIQFLSLPCVGCPLQVKCPRAYVETRGGRREESSVRVRNSSYVYFLKKTQNSSERTAVLEDGMKSKGRRQRKMLKEKKWK